MFREHRTPRSREWSNLTEHWRPSLVYDIQADGSTPINVNSPSPKDGGSSGNEKHSQFIDIRMEDLVHEANAGRLERVLIRKLDMDLPHPTGEWGY